MSKFNKHLSTNEANHSRQICCSLGQLTGCDEGDGDQPTPVRPGSVVQNTAFPDGAWRMPTSADQRAFCSGYICAALRASHPWCDAAPNMRAELCADVTLPRHHTMA